jgi:Flp pilus assembly protein CpaB
VLDASSLSCVDFPDRYLLPGTFTDPLEATGNTLRHTLHAGEPLLESALIPEHGGELMQEAIDRDFRAYPLPSSSVSFPIGELWAGSRVDVLAVSEEGALPLLENVEVLGISGRYSYPVSNEPGTVSSDSGECIILHITGEEACRLAEAQEKGKVELMLLPKNRP